MRRIVPAHKSGIGPTDPRRTSRWFALRERILAAEPTCRACKHDPATTVDHIVAIADGGPAFDSANLQSLCNVCHQAKTALTRTHQQRAAIRLRREDREERDLRRSPLTYDEAKDQYEATERWAAAQTE